MTFEMPSARYIIARSACAMVTFALMPVFMTLALSVLPAKADAQSCQDLFAESVETQTVESKPTDPLVSLEAYRDSILKEQSDVRSRVWTPDQIQEIRQKGRLEFEDMDRAVKYYRGLIVWKSRLLDQAIGEIKDKRLFENLKATWPQTVSVEGRDVGLFQYKPDFMRALDLARTLLKTADPTAIQVANLLFTIGELRSLRRNGWTDRAKLEAKIYDRLKDHFPEISSVKFEDLNTAAIAFRVDRMDCCGSGRCEGCTHPNVVFRDKNKWPGPTYDGPAPKSTLPLYRLMDRLRQDFPEEIWGWNFWDFAVPEANR